MLDDRHAGTSTSAGNTISAVALMPDGRPASGAVVHARLDKIVLSQYGVPESKLIGFTVADKDGHFQLTLTDSGGFFLEIKAASMIKIATPDSFPLVYFREYARKGNDDKALGDLTLTKSGSLRGRLQPDSNGFQTPVWIGIRGSDNFVKLEGLPDAKTAIPFGLTEVFPGVNSLAIYVVPEVGATSLDPVTSDVDSLARALAGTVTDVGTISIPGK